ncbi:MAG: N-6 DNA methylase [Thermoplasmata archaeon]
MTQLTLTVVNNRNMFSNQFLENILPGLPEWSQEEHIAVFWEIKKVYERERAFLTSKMKEAQIEQRFFRPIFKRLGFEFEVQEGVDTGAESPDYAFFRDRADLKTAHLDARAFYDRALAVGEVKRWEASLDSFGKDRYNRHKNPSFQIWLYLQQTKPKWGILSNGRNWRLYHEERPMDSYYEVDLVTILDTDDVEGFRYFFYLFRKEAFLPRVDEKPLLERVLQGSEDYAREVGDNLKENVYKALRILAQGFFDIPENRLDLKNEDHLALVQQNVMRLLYRLLFILYAEGKGLLGDFSYLESSYSLYKLKHEIAEKRDQGKLILPSGKAYWYRIKELVNLIDQGSEASNIPRDQFYVPAYNGGLFDPRLNEFLEGKVLGDSSLAAAIDLLARAPADRDSLGFVDYSTLDIRHLGSIYEGLLEYRLQVAGQQMVVVGKKMLWTPYEKYSQRRKRVQPFDSFTRDNRAEAGELYVATHKDERKATGSYYTPDPVVEYIVRHTLGPVLEEKWQDTLSSGKLLRDAVLSLRVLDPAMGSGHFLVGAIEFLAQKLLEAIQQDLEAGRLSEETTVGCTPDWAKREVLAHCIFGVDLNELAVELARVSLWLTTISKEKPLSFLDHRLKRGNSLIGAYLRDLAYYPPEFLERAARKVGAEQEQTELEATPFLDHLRGIVGHISTIGDETRQDIEAKKRLFQDLLQSEEYLRIKHLADIRTGIFFGPRPTKTSDAGRQYGNLTWAIMSGDRKQWEREIGSGWRRRALEIAGDKAFFHWELEFPDVFQGPNPGFDAVIGNPPYVSFGLGRVGKLERSEDLYIRSSFRSSAEYKISTYALFMELAIRLSRDGARQGLILPDSFLMGRYFSKIRTLLLDNTLVGLVHFAEDFWEAGDVGFPVIWIGKKGGPEPDDSHFSGVFAPSIESMVAGDIIERKLDRTQPLRNRRKRIRLIKDSTAELIIEKIESSQTVVSDLLSMHHGVRSKVGREKVIAKSPPSGDLRWKKGLVESNQVTRFCIEHRGDYVLIDPPLLFSGGWDPERIEVRKILIRRTGDSIISAVDQQHHYHTNALIYGNAVTNRVLWTLRYICAIFNSRLFTYYYRAITSKKGRTFPQVEIDTLEELCVPNLPTHLDRSSSLLDQTIRRLDEFINRRQKAEACTLIQELQSGPSGVLHELLVHLVSVIEGLCRQRNEASRIFLDWLQVASSSDFNEWSGKTKLQDFASGTLEELVEVLKSNEDKSQLQPHKRIEDLRVLRQNFDATMSEIRPLAERIEIVELLIDLLVYRLYGLTFEEVAIIEGCTVEDLHSKYQISIENVGGEYSP